MMKQAINKNSQRLALFAITCTLAVSLVHLLTKDSIALQEQQQLIRSLHEIIAPDRYNNEVHLDCVLVASQQYLGSSQLQPAFIARKDGEAIAIAIPSIAPDGYNGNINLLVAVNADGSVSGVRALSHMETPGLGDKVEIRKSDWITGFDQQILLGEKDPDWFVKKDGGRFDQFTGATITPRAVVKAVKNTVIYFNRNKDKLFNSINACQQGSEL